MPKPLIAYYSRRGQNYVNGQVEELRVGNTELVSGILRTLTGGDYLEIRQKIPYDADYYRCIDQAHRDLLSDARPELTGLPESIAAYDTVYLGYPNYWGALPRAVCTFLEAYDWTGKRIKPFCTHEGGGVGRSLNELKQLCPGAELLSPLALWGAGRHYDLSVIQEWVEGTEPASNKIQAKTGSILR